MVGDWRVDAARNQVSRADESAHLEPKAIEVLVYLARRAGLVVAREELLAAVWPGVIVGDDVLTQAVIKLRKALGDEARRPTYIETISKRGYRLVAPVSEPGRPATGPPASRTRRPRWPLVAVAGAALALAAAMLVPWPSRDQRPADAASRPMIAVLPLSNASGDPKRDYFTDGVTEDIVYALGRFSGLGVLSRAAVEGYKGHAPNLPAIRRELGARYLVTGSLREADGRLRLAVELSDTEHGGVLWSERYEGEARELFAFQQRMAQSIVGTLAVKVTRAEEERSAAKPPGSLEAYDLTLRARALVVKSERVANRQARELLLRAVQLAPDYGEAYVVLAAAEAQRSVTGWTEDPSASVRQGQLYARRALATEDPGTNARAHGQLANLYAIEGKLDEALAETARAIELNPSDALAYDMRGDALLWLGRADEAIAAMEMARSFNPVSRTAGGSFNRALAYYITRRYRESLAAADEALARYPDTAYLHAMRAATLAQLGSVQAARDAATQAKRYDPFFRSADFGNRFVKPQDMALLQEGLRKAGL
jgi:TolB-like protein/DNA-binding winged helix-turn-helix (wHTH) protein